MSRICRILAVVVVFTPSWASAQNQPVGAEPVALQTVPEGTHTATAELYDDPFEAYEVGAFDQALQGFLHEKIENPEDPVAALNVGSAHYEMRNYPEADRAFAAAALSSESEVRQRALYNLGNSAYRQGRLQESVEMYKSALELDPEDVDAKFNLEFVRDEIRRRHEEAQKRKDQQQESKDQQDQQDQQQQDQTPEDAGEQDQSDQDQQEQNDQGSDPSPSEPDQSPDSDQDGLSDQVERSGENPTDPDNPDSDGDRLPDGAEDLNRNGRVDPGETDPNNADTDGDGQLDSQESRAGAGQPGDVAEPPTALTPEEAERYLQALEEGRPVRQQQGQGRKRRTDKDW